MARRSNPGRTVGILAAVTALALAGVLAVSQLRGEDPPPEGAPTTSTPDGDTTTSTTPPIPTTTTTFQPLVTETGTPFGWAETLNLEGQIPVALIEHDDRFLLFSAAQVPDPGARRLTTGLQVRASDDGQSWDVVSTLDDRFRVTSVIDTPFGLVAYGAEHATGQGMVWRSEDGVAWDEFPIGDPHPSTGHEVYAALATEDVIVIAGSYRPAQGEVSRRVHEAASRHLGYEVHNAGWSGPELDGQYRVYVHGPLSILLHVFTIDELGLTVADLTPPAVEETIVIWSSTDGQDWVETTFPEWEYIYATRVGEDGDILIDVAPGESWIEEVFASRDGRTWVATGNQTPGISGTQHAPTQVQQWSGGLIGSPPGSADVALSDDGVEWRVLHLGGMLTHVPSWSVTARGVGDVGIALAAVTTGQIEGSITSDTPTGMWNDGEYRILYNPNYIQVYREDDLIWEHLPGDEEINVRYEPDDDTLTFIDPDTGEDLLTVAATELPQGRGFGSAPMQSAFLFTHASTWATPGVIDPLRLPRDWTIQDMTTPDGSWISHLILNEDRVILVTSGGRPFSFGPSGGPAEVRVLVAPIPDTP